jgi:hypothetical protein
MIKIEKVNLKESEIVEIDGEYKLLLRNERTIPCFLTNYSLKRGKEMGLLDGSLISDVIKLVPLTKLQSRSIEDLDSDTFKDLDEVKMLSVVYVACLGANKDFALDFDEFVSQYHESFDTLVELYINLIAGLMQRDPNQFAKGLQKSTKKGKKKLKPQP